MSRKLQLEVMRNGGAPSIADALSVLLEAAAERGAERALRRAADQLVRPWRRLFSVPDAALALDVSPSMLWRAIRRGLPTIKIGAATRIELETAVAWLRDRSKRCLAWQRDGLGSLGEKVIPAVRCPVSDVDAREREAIQLEGVGEC